jgi:hypothetical protein
MTECLLLVPPILGGVANLGTQILVHRRSQRVVLAIVAGFGAGAAVMLAVHLWLFAAEFSTDPRDAVFFLLGNIAIYCCGGFMCFQIINTGEASIRFRILREMRAFGRPVSRAELFARYNDGTLMRARLGRLLGNGQLRAVGGRYVLNAGSPMENFAVVILTLKRLIMKREHEFDRPGKASDPQQR